jgi:hypothetical protein
VQYDPLNKLQVGDLNLTLRVSYHIWTVLNNPSLTFRITFTMLNKLHVLKKEKEA